MTASPLVYFFAGVACVLAAWFVFGGVLALRHARTRGERAADLQSFLSTRGSRLRNAEMRAPGSTPKPTPHVTIGDLVRDDRLLKAAGDGMAARRHGPVG